MNLVIDCSIIMSSLLPDEKELEIQYHLYKIFVPSIFYLECNNVLLSAQRKKRINLENFQEYLDVIRNLPLNVDKFSSTNDSIHFISKLAIDNNLSSYDASYLELAIRLNAKIATFDKALIEACKLNSLEIFELKLDK